MNKRIIFYALPVIAACLISIAIILPDWVQAQTEQLTLEVTDFEDKILRLQDARIFAEVPTSCDSCPAKVETFDGIEVVDDSEKAFIFWKDIERIEKEDADNEAITISLTDGKTKTLILSTDPEQYVSGNTEDGKYYNTLRFRDVKLLKVIRKQEM